MSFDKSDVDLLMPLKFSTLKLSTANAEAKNSFLSSKSSEFAYTSLRYSDFFSSVKLSFTGVFTLSNSL